jgi:hypothetical protein
MNMCFPYSVFQAIHSLGPLNLRIQKQSYLTGGESLWVEHQPLVMQTNNKQERNLCLW